MSPPQSGKRGGEFRAIPRKTCGLDLSSMDFGASAEKPPTDVVKEASRLKNVVIDDIINS